MAYKFTSSRQLSNILDNIETVHKKDIHDYAGGHLNETYIHHSNFASNRKPWKSAVPPGTNIRRNDSRQSPTRIISQADSNMHEALFQFSLGTSAAVPTDKKSKKKSSRKPSPSNLTQSERKKSKDRQASASSGRSLYSKVQDNILIEEMKMSELLLPTPRSGNVPKDVASDDVLNDSLSSNLQMLKLRHSYQPTYDVGVTKADQFKKLKEFETDVLKKQECSECNVLSGEKAVKHLEERLDQDLQQSNFDGGGPNFHKLQLFSDTFDDVIEQTPTFGYILRCIKNEYDDHLAKLLDNQKTQRDLLQNQVDQMSSLGTSKPKELHDAQERVRSLENEAITKLEENDRLRRLVQEEKENLSNSSEQPVEVPHIVRTSYTNEPTLELADEIEHTKAAILEKLDTLQELRTELRDEFVPLTVCTHLEQCIKETEIEVQKLLKQNEYFEGSIGEMETDLKDAIQDADTSERDAKRIWKKVNSMRGLPAALSEFSRGTTDDASDDDEEQDKWNWYIS